ARVLVVAAGRGGRDDDVDRLAAVEVLRRSWRRDREQHGRAEERCESMTVPHARYASSLRSNSGLPEFGIVECRSRIYPTSVGEGWGEGIRIHRAIVTPHPNPLPMGEGALRVCRPIIDQDTHPLRRLCTTIGALRTRRQWRGLWRVRA